MTISSHIHLPVVSMVGSYSMTLVSPTFWVPGVIQASLSQFHAKTSLCLHAGTPLTHPQPQLLSLAMKGDSMSHFLYP